jgi:hypothetical protein
VVANHLIPVRTESLTIAEFSALSDFPPEPEWLDNIANPKTRRAGKIDAAGFPSA